VNLLRLTNEKAELVNYWGVSLVHVNCTQFTAVCVEVNRDKSKR